MYILIYNDNGIKKLECSTLNNAKDTKKILEKRGFLTCIFNKTFLSGIESIKDSMLKAQDNFILTLKLIDKIEIIESGLI